MFAEQRGNVLIDFSFNFFAPDEIKKYSKTMFLKQILKLNE